MEDPKGLKLFKELLAKTKAGRIRWEPGASVDEYFAVLPSGVTLNIRTSWDREDHIALVVRTDNTDLLRITPDVDGVTQEGLNELYEFARRQALEVDAKVDNVLGVLANL
jgi:hypothetical protein